MAESTGENCSNKGKQPTSPTVEHAELSNEAPPAYSEQSSPPLPAGPTVDPEMQNVQNTVQSRVVNIHSSHEAKSCCSMCCSLTGMFTCMMLVTMNGAVFALSIVGVSTQHDGGSEQALSIVGIVFSSIAFIVLFVLCAVVKCKRNCRRQRRAECAYA